eukprot:9489146-Pyramimonas_sp.AAC.2
MCNAYLLSHLCATQHSKFCMCHSYGRGLRASSSKRCVYHTRRAHRLHAASLVHRATDPFHWQSESRSAYYRPTAYDRQARRTKTPHPASRLPPVSAFGRSGLPDGRYSPEFPLGRFAPPAGTADAGAAERTGVPHRVPRLPCCRQPGGARTGAAYPPHRVRLQLTKLPSASLTPFPPLVTPTTAASLRGACPFLW